MRCLYMYTFINTYYITLEYFGAVTTVVAGKKQQRSRTKTICFNTEKES